MTYHVIRYDINYWHGAEPRSISFDTDITVNNPHLFVPQQLAQSLSPNDSHRLSSFVRAHFIENWTDNIVITNDNDLIITVRATARCNHPDLPVRTYRFGSNYTIRWDPTESQRSVIVSIRPNDLELDDGTYMFREQLPSMINAEPVIYDLFGRERVNVRRIQSIPMTLTNTLHGIFDDCIHLTDISGLANWDVSNVRDTSFMFDGCYSLSDITPISNWNMRRVRWFMSMFRSTAITNTDALANWDIRGSVNMTDMFHQCVGLESVAGLRNWGFREAGCDSMFRGCVSLRSVESIESWRERIINDSLMFLECDSLTDLSGWSPSTIGMDFMNASPVFSFGNVDENWIDPDNIAAIGFD